MTVAKRLRLTLGTHYRVVRAGDAWTVETIHENRCRIVGVFGTEQEAEAKVREFHEEWARRREALEDELTTKTAATLLHHYGSLDALLERSDEVAFLRFRGAASIAHPTAPGQ